MSTEVMQRYIADGIAVLERMEQASLHGNEISHKLLMQLVRDNQDTEYGRKYGFRDIRSYVEPSSSHSVFSRAFRVPVRQMTSCIPHFFRLPRAMW